MTKEKIRDVHQPILRLCRFAPPKTIQSRLFVFGLLVGLPRKDGQLHGWAGILANTWGSTFKMMDNQFKAFVNKGFSVERRKRSDASTTVLNSDQKKKTKYFHRLENFQETEIKKNRDKAGHLDEILF